MINAHRQRMQPQDGFITYSKSQLLNMIYLQEKLIYPQGYWCKFPIHILKCHFTSAGYVTIL